MKATIAMIILFVFLGLFFFLALEGAFQQDDIARANRDRAIALAQVERSKADQADAKTITAAINSQRDIIFVVVVAMLAAGGLYIIYKQEANKHDRFLIQASRQASRHPFIEADYYYVPGHEHLRDPGSTTAPQIQSGHAITRERVRGNDPSRPEVYRRS